MQTARLPDVRYFLPLIALSFIGLAFYGEFAFFHDYAWEDETSWFFFLLLGVAVCLLCIANFKVNLVAILFSCVCILSAIWVFFSSLLKEVYYYDSDAITEFQVYCYLIGHFSLLLSKPAPLFFLVGIGFCLRYKFLPVLCVPFLISGWLVGVLDGWDYRTFIVSSSFIIVLCSLATILDAWGLSKSKRSITAPSASQRSLSQYPSKPHKAKDQTAEDNNQPDDFSPPPCI